MSDPVARACVAPRLSGGVAHAMAAGVPVSPSARHFYLRENAPGAPTSAHGSTLGCPDNLIVIFPDNSAPPCVRHSARLEIEMCPRGSQPRPSSDLTVFRAAVKAADPHHCRGVGHHAIDGRSVLGTVQGSVRRFDRALPPQRGCRVGPGLSGLRALTVPARSSQIGNCVMAGNLTARSRQASSK